MAPIPIPTDSPEVLATDTGFSLWLFDTQFFLPLVMSSAITIAVWRWRFPCMTIKYLDTIVEGIRSLIRIDAQAAHHVDLDLLDVLPNMKAVKDNFQRLIFNPNYQSSSGMATNTNQGILTSAVGSHFTATS
uniref:Uncharacterized protein n=1 Tax=Moniliophthora roreri TaxID=221103 RepID=A0A0W0GFP8_MONRR